MKRSAAQPMLELMRWLRNYPHCAKLGIRSPARRSATRSTEWRSPSPAIPSTTTPSTTASCRVTSRRRD